MKTAPISVRHRPRSSAFLALTVFMAGLPIIAEAEQHTAGVPELSSRPGAAYTIYLNPAGFDFTGTWNNSANAPGFTPSLNDRLPTETFSAAEQEQIKILWSRMAQSYIGFNVNVTTVDPAFVSGTPGAPLPLAAGATDAERQAWYDSAPNLLHTVIGSQTRTAYIDNTLDGNGQPINPQGKWFSTGADGVSGVGIVAGTAPYTSAHTNWMFTEEQAGAATGGVINGAYIGGISAHENGHAYGLNHQGDFSGGVKINEYSYGDDGSGIGTYVPTLGDASGKQRVAWRLGNDSTGALVNDVAKMLSTNTIAASGLPGAADLHLIEDGIGHTFATATPLPLIGNDINYSAAQGVIVPASETNPQPIGAANYTNDLFSFTLDGPSTVSLTANNGSQFLTPGVADPLPTLRSTLSIWDANGVFLDSGIESLDTLSVTYSGLLGLGTYFARIGSFGGHAQTNASAFDAAYYYDMGSYFLTGSIVPVPEASTVVLLFIGAIYGTTRRQRRSA